MSEGSWWFENLNGPSSLALHASRMNSSGLGGVWGPYIILERLEIGSKHRVRPLKSQEKPAGQLGSDKSCDNVRKFQDPTPGHGSLFTEPGRGGEEKAVGWAALTSEDHSTPTSNILYSRRQEADVRTL